MVEDYGYDTPEEAARGDIPERFARIVWLERSDDRAVVLLEVNLKPPYFDLSRCRIEEGRWVCDSEGGTGDERPERYADWLAKSGPSAFLAKQGAGRLAGGRRRAENQVEMVLLAYSVRRAVGALIVLLVVIWLTWFGVSHFSPSVRHPTERNASAIQAFHQHQPALANEWNRAALEIGVGLLVLLGVGAVLRLRKRKAA